MLLDDLGDFLSTGSLGLTTGTNLFLGTLPDTPDRCAAVFETGGIAPVYTHGRSAALVERPRFQVLTRATTYQGARMLAHNIFRRLDTVRGATIGGVLYHWISAVHSPYALTNDGSDRARIVTNFDVIKDVHTSTST